MFHEQQTSPNCSLSSPNTNPNPNPTQHSSSIHHQGTDPDSSYKNPSGFQFQPGFVLIQQASADGPVSHDPPSFDSVGEKPTTILNSLWNTSWLNQYLANEAAKRTGQLSGGMKSIRCKVCYSNYNINGVLEQNTGEKHGMNSQMQIPPNTSGTFQDEGFRQRSPGDSSVAVGGELKMGEQKMLEGGASITFLIQCTNCKATARLLNGGEILVAANSDIAFSTGQSVQPCSNGTLQRGPSESMQSFGCEVCKITCNSSDVLSKHKIGKKHLKNLKHLTCNSASTDAPAMALLIGPVENQEADDKLESRAEPLAPLKSEFVSLISSPLRPCNDGTQEKGTSENLQSACCEICKVSCNSSDRLSQHKLGKKHLKNLKKLTTTSTTTSTAAPTTTQWSGPTENLEATAGLLTGVETMVAANSNAVSSTILMVQSYDNGTLKQEGPREESLLSAWCEVCNVGCNTNDVLSRHKFGKKHMKNLAKLNNIGINYSTSVSATTLLIGSTENLEKVDALNENLLSARGEGMALSRGPMENSEASKGKTVDLGKKKRKNRKSEAPINVDTKRKKIIESGGEVDDVRVCTVCSVVCNNPVVFDSHISGKKHAAMVKKQAEAGLGASGLPPQMAADV